MPTLSEIATQAVASTVEVITPSGFGSGFIIHPDGLVVSACHVIASPEGIQREVKIRLNAGTVRDVVIDAVVVRAHARLDFALIWLMEGGPYPALTLADPRKLQFAQPVLAIGSPSGLSNTVSSGIVSNPAQHYRGVDCIQTNADIDHGNSGGPLISEQGVVGVNVWGLGQITAAKFAIPIDYMTEDIARVLRLGREASVNADFCTNCGFSDTTPMTWYCPNCGCIFEDEAESSEDSEEESSE